MNKLISKTLFYLLLIGTLIHSGGLHAQTIDLTKKISINAVDTPLEAVLEEIARITDLNFSYSLDQIPYDKKITIRAENKSIRWVLNKISKEANINYVIVENQIVLKAKSVKVDLDDDGKPIVKHTISGYVRDQESGEFLISASVFIEDLFIGTSTNEFGFYSLTLPEGEYTIKFSYVGYNLMPLTVDLFNSVVKDVALLLDFNELTEVEVESEMHEDLLDGSQMSTIDLKTSDVNKMQGFLGEVEVIKSLQSIPGIKSFGDGSVFFHVRGGNKDQNLILIDDAPIYNPSHLLGFFSSFTPDAIKDVKIYKADIPLSQGGALSSLIDIRTKDGNMQKYGVYGNIGLIANKLSVEGPFVKDKSSFFFSVRRSHIDFLFGLITEEESNISFYDVNAKVNTKINEKNRIFLSFYSGLDQFGIPGISWSNGALTFRWNHLFNDRLFSNTIINTSRYDYFLYLNSQKTEFWQETITNGSFKTNFGFYKDPKNTIRFGLNISQHYFNPGNLTRSGAADEPAKILQSNARHLVTYISNEKKLNKKVTVRYGLRTNLWSNVGPSTYFLIGSEYEVTDTIIADRYEVFNRYNNPEPRISLRWSIDSVSSVKTSYGRTVQYLQLLSNSVSPFTSLEVWLPSGPNIKPQKADQVALGYYRKFMKAKSEFSAEVYYKLMYNQIDYEDHANLLLNPAIEGELRFGTGTAYGLELMMQRRQGRLTGWIAYTLSRAILEIEGINNDQPYPAFYDRPHDLTVYLDFELAERWELFANWIYTTGSAITTPTAFYTFQGTQVPIYDSKHNDRMPDYHRLDFSARWQLNRKKDNNFRHTLTFSIYNVYGRANPISINFNKKEIIFEEFIIPSNVLEGPKYVPTQRSLLGVIPSISYQFEF